MTCRYGPDVRDATADGERDHLLRTATARHVASGDSRCTGVAGARRPRAPVSDFPACGSTTASWMPPGPAGTCVASPDMPRLAIVLVVLAGGWIPCPAVAAESDLTPTIYDVHFDGPGAWVSAAEVAEGCAKATTGRTLLRFGTRVMNLGPDALVIGNPGCPDCTTNPGAVCQDPRFICSESLGLPHFQSAARFELLDPNGADLVVGAKRGYCFNDDDCLGGKSLVYTDCNTNQGLSVGCVDDYEPFLYCQYLDVTDVPGVMTRAFTVRVTIDTADLLPDPNRANNVAEVAIPGCGDGILQPGGDRS